MADHATLPPPEKLKTRAAARHWDTDEIVVASFAFLGFAGGVFLPLFFGFTKVPPIVVSFLLATGLAALAYRYLGGIQGASFATGTFKLGGALAALVGIALLINNILASQVQPPPPAAQLWELHGKVTDEHQAALHQLVPEDFRLTPPNTRIDPGGNFTINFFTQPTLTGGGTNYPSLTIGHGSLSATLVLEPEQLKGMPGFKMDEKLRRFDVDHISLKADATAAYNSSGQAPEAADPSRLPNYNPPSQ